MLERLQDLSGVAGIELSREQGGVFSYRLRTRQDAAQTAADVAKAVVEAGWQLFALQPEERSLEKVFHEITDQEVAADAA